MIKYCCIKNYRKPKYKKEYKKMIICFNEKINSLSEENLNFNYIQKIMPTLNDVKDHKCPYCNRKNALINYGHYNRNVSFLCKNEIKNFYISVQRVRCKSCKRTHALLPCFIIPYVIMASFSIAKIVANTAQKSAYQICKLFSLSHQIIYTYMRLVLDFFMDFKVLNNKKEYIKINNFNKEYFLTNCENLSDFNHKIDFFEFYNWILFMQKFRNNSSPKVGVFISKGLPT